MINSIKNNKAAGYSGITYDFWKKSKDNTKKILVRLMNRFLEENQWPTEWKENIIF